MAIRVAHVTDIHWTLRPPLRRIPGKRVLGAANLYLRGRRHQFPEAVQEALVAHLVALAPDAVVITGDLTATALPDEFAWARRALQPVLDRFPTLVLPGNHDVYTRGARRDRRIAEHFGPWMGLDGPHAPVARLDVGEVTVLGLDPCRPHPVLSSGMLPAEQLGRLSALLDALVDRSILLALHYPVLDRHGAIYAGLNHGLRNARALIGTLGRAERVPLAILHGHEHHGYTVDLDAGGRRIPIFDCGSSGYAWMPERRRAAAMCVYTVDGGAIVDVRRDLYAEGGFKPEPGGAFATGR